MDNIKPSYKVVIMENEERAELYCMSFEEALQVKQMFLNYGKCQSVTIEQED